MTDPTTTTSARPATSRNLLRSTLIALAVAIVLLVTAVLPAEYGVDPTGIGRLLGLTEMGRVKVALAKEAARLDSVEAAAPTTTTTAFSGTAGTGAAAMALIDSVRTVSAQPPTSTAVANSHVTEVVLKPNEGKEIKLVMRKDARVTYSWSTDKGVVNYDTHADAPGIKYHGYAKGSGKNTDEGVLIAAFDGAHGWFWRNRGRAAVTITLRTNGDYTELKRM